MSLNVSEFNNKHMVFGTLIALNNRMQSMGDRFYKEITIKQLFLVLVLQLFGDYEPTLKELSDAAGSSYQNVKQIVLKLEKLNIVVITSDGQDKRKMRIKVTEKCNQLLVKYNKKAQQFLDILFDGIASTELENILEILKKMEQNLLCS